jgi:hypothetical protein
MSDRIVVFLLLLFGRRLNNTLAGVSGRGDTSEGIRGLRLFQRVSHFQYPRLKHRQTRRGWRQIYLP